MKKVQSVSIVQTPFQIISLLGCTRFQEYADSHRVVVFLDTSHNDISSKQSQKLLTESGITFEHFKVTVPSHTYYVKLIYYYFRLFLKGYSPEYLIIGDYRVRIIRLLEVILKPKKVVFIDDGAASIPLILDKDPGALLECTLYSVSVSFMSNLNEILTIKRPNYIVHSLYLYKNKSINSVVFEKAKWGLNIVNKNTVNDIKVAFIGGPYSEKFLMSERNELHYIQEAFNKYRKLDGKVYIPHRSESEGKLNKIKKMGYQVRRLNYPIEICVSRYNFCAERYVGFWSSALLNIKFLQREAQIEYYNVLPLILNKNSVENVKKIYQAYNSNGILPLNMNN
jgi:hypothetical protein